MKPVYLKRPLTRTVVAFPVPLQTSPQSPCPNTNLAMRRTDPVRICGSTIDDYAKDGGLGEV